MTEFLFAIISTDFSNTILHNMCYTVLYAMITRDCEDDPSYIKLSREKRFGSFVCWDYHEDLFGAARDTLPRPGVPGRS